MKATAFNMLLGLMVLTLVLTLLAICFQLVPKADLLTLSKLLFSWQVVGGGLTVGAASTFKDEIKGVLRKVAG